MIEKIIFISYTILILLLPTGIDYKFLSYPKILMFLSIVIFIYNIKFNRQIFSDFFEMKWFQKIVKIFSIIIILMLLANISNSIISKSFFLGNYIELLRPILYFFILINYSIIFYKKKYVLLLKKTVIGSFIIQAFFCIIQFFNPFDVNRFYINIIASSQSSNLIGHPKYVRTVGLTDNPNVFGVLLAIYSLFFLYLILKNYKDKKNYFFYFIAFLLIFTTMSRTGLICFILSNLFLIAIFSLKKTNIFRSLIFSFSFLLIVVVTIFALPERVTMRYRNMIAFNNLTSWKERILRNKEHISIILDEKEQFDDKNLSGENSKGNSSDNSENNKQINDDSELEKQIEKVPSDNKNLNEENSEGNSSDNFDNHEQISDDPKLEKSIDNEENKITKNISENNFKIWKLIFGHGSDKDWKYHNKYFDNEFISLIFKYGIIGLFSVIILYMYLTIVVFKKNSIEFLFYLSILLCGVLSMIPSAFFEYYNIFSIYILIASYCLSNKLSEFNKEREKIMNKNIIVCKRCVMDNISTKITFDEKGICNHCTAAIENMDKIWKNNVEGKNELDILIEQMKKDGKGKKYDCFLGLSGGIDSCYTAYYLTKTYNVRILAVHIDAGWNTPISEDNVRNLCKKLKIDLKTIKMDYEEMYDLQRAYFLSQVINQDVPQDNVFFTELNRFVIKNDINWIAEGQNYSSESILPNDWKFDAMDSSNLKSIHKKYGLKKLKKFKPLSFYEAYILPLFTKKMNVIKPLNLINYNKSEAIKILEKELGFKYYGSKHSESIFTRLYQGYILPEKYGVVKAKAHLSSLIVSNQMTRDEAIYELEHSEYKENPKLLEQDIKTFISKIGISRDEFNELISNGYIGNHKNFKNHEFLIRVTNHFIRKYNLGKRKSK